MPADSTSLEAVTQFIKRWSEADLSERVNYVGGRLGGRYRPRCNKTRCFDPFPACTEPQKARIRDLAEALDAHRKRAQADHGLGLTDIYNVREKLRAGEVLTAKDKKKPKTPRSSRRSSNSTTNSTRRTYQPT